jgi:hypothetical protein
VTDQSGEKTNILTKEKHKIKENCLSILIIPSSGEVDLE